MLPVDPLPVDPLSAGVLTLDAALRHHSRQTPRAAALTFAGRRYNYGELDATVDRVSDALCRLGLRRGERFALAAGNSDRFVIALLAAFRAGAIAVPLNPASAPRELDYLLTDSGAAILAVDTSADTSPADVSRPTAGGTLRAVVDLGALVTDAGTATGVHPPIASGRGRPPDGDDDALILYTSGTTGRPRGALFDHRRVLAAARAVIGACSLRATDRLLIAAPLSHAAALGVLLLPTVACGAEAVVLPRFDASDVIATMAARRVSVFFGVPTMYQLLLGETALHAADLTSWRTALFGGAAMPVATIEALRRALPGLGLLQLCGQTEAGPGGIYSSPAQVIARPGASGHQALPGSEVRVVAADGTDVGAGEAGEMLIRADSVMKGYWRNPAATAEVLTGGWLRTGDVARLDDDGSLTLIDRLRDMIVTGGRNVYSAEVERVIMTHPAVVDCAVIGEPDALYGETVSTVIEVREGCGLNLDDVQNHCRAQLTGYKIPRRLSLRSIPRTATGKTDKAALRRDAAATHDAGTARDIARAGGE